MPVIPVIPDPHIEPLDIWAVILGLIGFAAWLGLQELENYIIKRRKKNEKNKKNRSKR
jgi:hypothetical protein